MLLSVIIPVKNGEATLERCLRSIKEQTIAENLEIIILDSSSVDDSVEIAKEYGARIINIAPIDFNHGLTRNLGVEVAQGQLLFYTVQDAFLSSPKQLELMVQHFEDEDLQGVTGIQGVPVDVNKNPALWFRRYSDPITVYKQYTQNSFLQLSPEIQFSAVKEWDNVNAMYRKKALEAIPFANTAFAEDKLWARAALEKGMKLAFVPSSLVYHYHHRDFSYSFKIEYLVNYNFYKHFGIHPSLPPFAKSLITACYRILRNRNLSFYQKVYWIQYNFKGIFGSYISNIIFLTAVKLLTSKALVASLKIFCNTVPQGRENFRLKHE